MEEENHQEEEELTEIKQAKPKKELSQKQKEHLDTIRVKALERKREIKLMKNKQYEEKVSKLKVEQVEIQKEEPPKEGIKQEEPKTEPKKKKLIKKVIKYVEADSDEEEQDEVIVKQKKKIGPKPEPEPIQQPKELSYNELLYQTSLEKMQNRIMNERAKQLIHGIIPTYF